MAKKEKINIQQERFCKLYTGNGEYFGNAVWCYILAYKFPVPLIDYSLLVDQQKLDYNTARANASELLTNTNIVKRCNELLDALFKNEIVDRELVRVIMQNEELASKVSAIREYNKLKKRVSDTPPVNNIFFQNESDKYK